MKAMRFRTARHMPVHADGERVGTTPSHRPRIGLTTIERYVRTGYSEEIVGSTVDAVDSVCTVCTVICW